MKRIIEISEPVKSWWPGDERVEKLMPPVAEAIKRHLPWPSREFVDIYNTAYEAIYKALTQGESSDEANTEVAE